MTNPITIDQIKELLSRISGEPWRQSTNNVAGEAGHYVATNVVIPNARFIAAAPAIVKQLLSDNERLTARVKELSKTNQALKTQIKELYNEIEPE